MPFLLELISLKMCLLGPTCSFRHCTCFPTQPGQRRADPTSLYSADPTILPQAPAPRRRLPTRLRPPRWPGRLAAHVCRSLLVLSKPLLPRSWQPSTQSRSSLLLFIQRDAHGPPASSQLPVSSPLPASFHLTPGPRLWGNSPWRVGKVLEAWRPQRNPCLPGAGRRGRQVQGHQHWECLWGKTSPVSWE